MRRVVVAFIILLSVVPANNCRHADQHPPLVITEAQLRIGKKWEKVSHGGPLLSISFSPDGKKIASAGWDTSVNVWDSQSGELVQTLREKMEVLCVAFSPDGTTLAYGGFDRRVHLFDGDKEALSLEGHTGCVDSVAFSPDGSLVGSGSWDGTVRLWNRWSGKLLNTFRHEKAVFPIAFSADGGTIASTGPDIPITLWETRKGEKRRSLARTTGEDWSGKAVAFSPNSNIVAAETKGAILLWVVQTGTFVRELQDEEMKRDWVTALAFSPDGSLLANGVWGHKVKIWDWATGRVLNELLSDGMPVRSLAFSPDGTLLAVGGDGLLSVWGFQK